VKESRCAVKETDLDQAQRSLPAAGKILEARLQTVLERVIDWLKYEEAKNGVLITLNGVAAGLLPQWAGSCMQGWLSYVFKFCILAFLVSLLIGLSSFYPKTDPQKVNEHAAKKRRKAENDEKEHWEPSVLFFKDLAGLKRDEYLKKLRSATAESGGGGATQLEMDYAGQIIVNAELTLFKISVFRWAFVITFAAIAVACLAGFGCQLVEIFRRLRNV
jgi:hypothetical protein